MRCDRARDLIGAYLDGELSPEERRDVGDHLAACRTCEAMLADDERIARSLRRSGRVPAPATLEHRIRAGLEKVEAGEARTGRIAGIGQRFRIDQQAVARTAKRVAAYAAACVLSAIATWWVLTTAGEADRIARDVLNAHIRSLLQESPVQVATSDQHTVRPWFAGRTDFAPDVKDLTAEGFPLLGGRLDYVGGRRVGVIVFKRRLHVINVLMWPSATADRVAQATTRDGYSLLSWTRNGIAYWAVSDLNAGELSLLQRLL